MINQDFEFTYKITFNIRGNGYQVIERYFNVEDELIKQ